jgi:deoxyribodipyrimidine photo-lyase
MAEFLAGQVDAYAALHDRLAGGTSMLSPHLHFGTVSARELEAGALQGDSEGRRAFRRQVAWRDFYAHVLLHHPANAREEFQERFRALEWEHDPARLAAWEQGRTGFPLVDAAMRQLAAMGWMHNRARLVVGSFLTKDLQIDWRAGERHFMRHLVDGDEAQNNGNWQWIASVGVDPQPYFRRMYNPARHQERFDPDGAYVRRWVPELRDVPLARLPEPWTMTPEEQAAAGCVIGRDYPAPIVDRRVERGRAAERYRAVVGGG